MNQIRLNTFVIYLYLLPALFLLQHTAKLQLEIGKNSSESVHIHHLQNRKMEV